MLLRIDAVSAGENLEIRMEGYSNVEISQELGIRERTIRRLLERLRGLAEQE